MFPTPAFAFRMFLAQFGTPEGNAQLAAMLENLELTADENAKLLPILTIARDHFVRKVPVE